MFYVSFYIAAGIANELQKGRRYLRHFVKRVPTEILPVPEKHPNLFPSSRDRTAGRYLRAIRRNDWLLREGLTIPANVVHGGDCLRRVFSFKGLGLSLSARARPT
jgi:hypothetical protein